MGVARAGHQRRLRQALLAWRCGITGREAREYLRVAEALQELPATRAAFARGELTFTKVRALTRVATASSEERLLELAGALTASQLERALRVFRRVTAEDARETHELEYVDYYFDDDGSLYLRARLAAEDGTLLVKALEAARERVVERRREERAAAASSANGERRRPTASSDPPRSAPGGGAARAGRGVARRADERASGSSARRSSSTSTPPRSSADGRGRSELEDGPVDLARDGPAARLRRRARGAGRARRPAGERRPQAAHRAAERSAACSRRATTETCCFPGCERRRHLQAHHRQHWAHGGETSLDNLVLLCFHHHRLVHEGGYTVEDDGDERPPVPQPPRRSAARPSPPRPPPGERGRPPRRAPST